MSTKKHNMYQLLYIYSIPPDDGLQICPKYVEVDWRNKLRINTASSWLSWHGSITPFTRAHNLSLPKSNKTSPYASLDYFNNHFNTYFLCPSVSSLWTVSTLFTMYFFCISHFPHASYLPVLFNHAKFHCPDNKWWTVRRCIQDFGGETWGKVTTWKTEA